MWTGAQWHQCLQAFELGQARWEFENTRKAFQDTMRQFAPGFGGGTFISKAVVKRSAEARAPA